MPSRCLDGTFIGGAKLALMNGEKQRAVTATERILGCALRDVTPLGNDERRNLVLRATTPSRSIIVKATRDETYAPRDFEHGLIKEWVATAFLTRHAPGHAPAFLGGDAELGLVVLEDLGARWR